MLHNQHTDSIQDVKPADYSQYAANKKTPNGKDSQSKTDDTKESEPTAKVTSSNITINTTNIIKDGDDIDYAKTAADILKKKPEDMSVTDFKTTVQTSLE